MNLTRLNFLFFCLLLLGNLINIWSPVIYTTMDGPAHLYNAGLLNLYDSSDLLQEYYSSNVFYLPNYLPHYILKYLLLVFDPFVAEKLFLSLIVIFLPLSFYFAVAVYTKSKQNFSILIMSLVFSFLFNSGFFNFCFAFIFLNIQLILLNSIFNNGFKIGSILLLFLNSFVLFYSHPFVYLISVAITFLMMAVHFRSEFKKVFLNTFYLTLTFLPTLILFYLFYTHIPIPPQSASPDLDLSIQDKLGEFLYFAPAITFVGQEESQYSVWISVLLLILSLFVIINRFVLAKTERTLVPADIFIIGAMLIVPIVFLTHNGILGGLFTKRLSYLFFYFLIFWLCCNMGDSKWLLILSILVTTYSYYNLSLFRQNILKDLSYNAKEVYQAAAFIQNKSVVYRVNYSNNYLFGHYSNYAGINKEVVISENYEAILRWFPLSWTDKIFHVKCTLDKNDKHAVIPNYVMILGDQNEINNPANGELKNFIDNGAFLCYQSKSNYCRLYKVLNTVP